MQGHAFNAKAWAVGSVRVPLAGKQGIIARLNPEDLRAYER